MQPPRCIGLRAPTQDRTFRLFRSRLPRATRRPPLTLVEVVNELLLSKSKRGRSDQYLRQLRHCFALFAKGRSRTPIGAITTAELEEWLDGLDVSDRTVKGRIQYLKLLFGFAVRRGYLSKSPADPLELPTITSDTTGIHTPAEVRAVMAAALAEAPRVALVLALRYFAVCGPPRWPGWPLKTSTSNKAGSSSRPDLTSPN